MTSMARVPRCAGWVSAAIAALVPALAAAQPSQSDAAPGAWRCDVSLYGYLPSLSSTSSAPADANGTPIDINAKKIVDNLKLTAMAAFEAHNGSRGGSTDLIYLDLGGSKQQSREFTIGGAIAPVGATGRPRLGLQWNDLDARRRMHCKVTLPGRSRPRASGLRGPRAARGRGATVLDAQY